MIRNLRLLAILEGVSYILFGITMPLKYVWGMPGPNYWVGMIHGVLFILYCILVVVCWQKYKWSFKKAFIVGIASLIPFGTFYIEKKYLREG